MSNEFTQPTDPGQQLITPGGYGVGLVDQAAPGLNGFEHPIMPVSEIGGLGCDALERDVETTRRVFANHGISCEVTRVGEVGARVEFLDGSPPPERSPEVVPSGHKIWYDMDDSILSYAYGKQARQAQYQTYLAEHGLSSDPRFAQELLCLTDVFARWDGLYYIEAHKAALRWATAELRPLGAGASLEDLPRLQDVLARIKLGDQQAAPFAFRNHQLHIDHQSLGQHPAADIEPVFDPSYRPGIYEDVLTATQELHAQGHGVGLLTLGELPFQAEKLARLYRDVIGSGGTWPFATAGITVVPKGQFVKALADEADHDPDVRRQYFPDQGRSLVLADDDPGQLEAFLSQTDLVQARFGAQLHALRLLRIDETTKHSAREWAEGSGPNRSTYLWRVGGAVVRLPDVVRVTLA